VDVVRVLTEQPDTDGARNSLKVLKIRLKEEGSQLVTNCNQLKMRSQDGKNERTRKPILCLFHGETCRYRQKSEFYRE
jgi:hypothetical protein